MNKQLYFTKEIWERLTEEAKKNGISRSGYIRMVLLKYWEDNKRNG